MKRPDIHFSGFLFIALMLFGNSCINTKKLRYFSEIENDSTTLINVLPPVTIIQPSDILQISVYVSDAVTSLAFNSQPGPASASATSNSGSGYLVNDSGYIVLPMIGEIKASGMTKVQLADTISRQLVWKQFALDPIVSVRLSNFKITVLGEVNQPGVITVLNEQITVTEALASAGDLTVYGKRSNILVIREVNGKRIYRRFDLTKNVLFNTEIYYLQNKDIIYVEPVNAKAALLDRTGQKVSLLLSSLTIAILVYTQFIIN